MSTSILVNNPPATFILYPNPASDIIQLQFANPLNEKGNVVIYDICGRIVKKVEIDFNNNTIEVDIKNLNQGNYCLKLNGNSYTYAKHFIVTR